MSTTYTNPEDNEAEGIRRNRRVTSIAKTYTKSVAEDRAQIDQALKAGLTLSTNALLRAGYADNAEAALTELNQKDN
ncbi:hypothetical protein [Cryobacterium tagatosivorans]|uniref:Uncharacterized protein n=1 Tax=Cryobacterium tagatosivorans TaxID=1259199 RepID=A0A4R8UCQ0_9MICO|nr:hypothetical protein [Cryobacterium tagatosivorans]TFB46507.1 hypothetical protein E3O23_17110 [Cryobacterium tagatosivorans]